MLRELRNYINESDFKVTYIFNKVNVVNYLSVDHFDDDKILIRYVDGILKIKGEGLVITKLLDDEILVSGDIKLIEFK